MSVEVFVYLILAAVFSVEASGRIQPLRVPRSSPSPGVGSIYRLTSAAVCLWRGSNKDGFSAASLGCCESRLV